MKKIPFLLLLAIVISMLQSCRDKTVEPIQNTSNYFLYHSASATGKYNLYLSPEFIFIKADSSLSEEQIQSIPQIDRLLEDSAYILMPGSRREAILRTKALVTENTMERLVEHLKADKRVLYVEPFYGFTEFALSEGRSEESSSAGECVLKLKHDSYRTVLDSLVKKWNIPRYEQSEYYDRLVYALYVDKYSSYNALELGNKLYESGICEWSQLSYNSITMRYASFRRKL